MGVYPELAHEGRVALVATVMGHDGCLPTQRQLRAVQAVLNVVASILVLSPIRFRLDATITLDEAEA